jgi:CRP-like cAMP-binding protein
MRGTPKLVQPNEFVTGIRGHQLSEILRAAEIREVRARRVIMREGTWPTHLFLLKSGRARFYRSTDGGQDVLLSTIGPGDIFGLSNLLARPVPYIGTAETTRDSELLVWDQSRIRRLAEKYPRLSQNALGIALRYLAKHFDRLYDLIACTATERVARILLHMANESSAILPNAAEIAVTNAELAEEAHVSPFTVSRLIRRWTRKGALRKSRGKLAILSPEQLFGN